MSTARTYPDLPESRPAAEPAPVPRAAGLRKPMRNAGKLTLGRVVQAVCSLAYLAFATRSLGPGGFGQLILIHTLCLAVGQFARFDSWQSVVRFGAPALRDDAPAQLRRVVNFGLLLDLTGILLGVAAYAVLIFPLGAWFGLSPELRQVALVYGVVVIAVITSSGSAMGLLQLLDRFGTLAITATLEPIIRLVGAAALFFHGGGLEGFLILWLCALGASHVGTVASAFLILARRGPAWRFRFDVGAWLRPEAGQWRYAVGTHWVGAVNVAQDYLPMLAAGGVIGATGAGLLKTAKLFSDVLVVSTTKLLVPALLPELARLKAGEGRALAGRVNAVTLGIFSLIFLVLVFAGKNLIHFIAGPAFVAAYPAMLWLAFSGVVGATSFGFETLLTANGAIRRVVWANSVSIALYFLALVVLLPLQGVAGVGMAAVVSAGVRSILLWRSARQMGSARLEPAAGIESADRSRETPPGRVGFLFNHDHLHQIPHVAPIIAALSERNPALEIHVFATGERQGAFLEGLLPPAVRERIHRQELSVPGLFRGLDGLTGHAIPFQRLGALVRHRARLAEMDVLVVPETTSLFLHTLLGRRAPRLIYTQHGAGDRAVGFKPSIRRFDHVLVPGAKIRDRMLAAEVIRPEGFSEVGYPKFDGIDFTNRPRLFANDNPVVLYNPHCHPALSSWFRDGLEVLEFFRNRPDLNLIVAPHVMLFARHLHLSTSPWRLAWRRQIPPEYLAAPNILIDTGSPACVDMTYPRAADLYLGDVSSQVYEFILEPRPCIFLNGHRIAWEGDSNFAHWHLGPVIGEVEELSALLENRAWHGAIFARRQTRARRETFGASIHGGAARAARAIERVILREGAAR